MLGTPDFPTGAAVAAQRYAQLGGGAVDGVLALDVPGLCRLLGLTGPVQVQGVSQKLDASNCEHFLLFDQYLQFASQSEAIQGDVLNTVANAVFNALTTRRLPSLLGVADVVGGAVAEHRIEAWSPAVQEEAAYDSLGMSGAFRVPSEGDALTVLQANAAPNKLDAYVERKVTYRVDADTATGATAGSVTIALHNTATAGIDPRFAGNDEGLPNGTVRLRLRVVTPLGLRATRVGGEPISVEDEPAGRMHDYAVFVAVPPGGDSTVVLDLAGVLQAGPYQLQLISRPTVTGATTRVAATQGRRPPDVAHRVTGADSVVVDTSGKDVYVALPHE